jgi:hypothetical protein
MIIPKTPKKRDDVLDQVVDICTQSRRDRDLLYLFRRRFLDYGTNDYTVECKYNRLEAHLDLVSSFLYAADHCRFNIAAPRNSDDASIEQIEALEDEWNDSFRDCGLAYMFGEAVYWALALDSMFIKVGWNDSTGDLFGKMLMPGDFSVYDESEPDLDSQEAFLHTYCLNWDNAVLRLLRAGKQSEIKKMRQYAGRYDEDLPPILNNLIIDATSGPNLSGAMMGRASADFRTQPTYEAQSENPMVRFHEVWVWDDTCEDYCIFTKCDGVDGALADSRETIAALRKADADRAAELYRGESNIFGIEQEHPFVPIVPYRRPDFFFGKAHSDILIPLQIWTNERLQQIADLLEQNVDPSKVLSGFSGLTEEKIDALGGPGASVYEMAPNAKVDMLRPPVNQDLFGEFREIGSIFLEASGLTETVMGRGEQGGARSDKQAKRMAMTGSGRIKKVAVGLEQSLVQLAEKGIKLIQRNSVQRMRTDSGQVLLPAQVSEPRHKIRVAGHSHSPLFSDESKEQAAGLFKAQAIDREMLVRMLNPPNADAIIHKLRKRVVAEQQQAKQEQEHGHAPRKPQHPRAA